MAIKDNQAYQVYTTMDYKKFKLLRGNREVLENRKRKIRESVKAVGWLRAPIIVNKYFEIIDGQARFAVRFEDDLPIEYIMDPDASMEACQAMNYWSTSWNTENYVHWFAANNNENYVHFERLLKRHKNIPITTLYAIVANRIISGGVKKTTIMNGGLICTEDDLKRVEDELDFVEKHIDVIKKIPGQQARVGMSAVGWIVGNTPVDRDRLSYVLKTRYPEMDPCISAEVILRSITKIYNSKLPKSKRIYFETEYEKKR